EQRFKRKGKGIMKSLFITIGLIFLTSLCDTINQLFLKSSINSISFNVHNVGELVKFIFKIISTPRVWIGFLFTVASLCIWLVVLSRADLNLAFSIDSMHYILIAVASMIFLKEKISVLRWLGISVIVFGIILVTVS
ncbi:MAG: hypothetical protein PHE58_03975, partial [Candidatus Omnitrophica bacterium]|nr:hypothetical protein [Candidatus Omnitrophota bacterium]